MLQVKAHSFEIDADTTSYEPYRRGGIVAEAKQPKKLNFKLLRDALADPGDFLFSDFSKLERSATLHVAFQALEAFRVSRVKSFVRDVPTACKPLLFNGQPWQPQLFASETQKAFQALPVLRVSFVGFAFWAL